MIRNVFTQLFLIAALCITVLNFSSCKKETTPTSSASTNNINTNSTLTNSTQQQTQSTTMPSTRSTTYYMGGLLGTETISLNGTPSYYTDSTDASVIHEADDDQHGNGNGHAWGQANGNNGHGNDDNDGDEDDNTMRVTGSRWTTQNAAGLAATQGSVDVHGLIVRIYVTPIANGHSQYYDMVALGSYGYVTSSTTAGVYLTVRDASGTLWTTKGDQTGSTFNIVNRGADMGRYTSFSATFNAKMYDGRGNMKTFTNGTLTALAGL